MTCDGGVRWPTQPRRKRSASVRSGPPPTDQHISASHPPTDMSPESLHVIGMRPNLRRLAPHSPERRLVEAAELAAVQRVAALAQQVEGLEADLQVLADGRLVERAGRARQLDLAVQGLVGDTQQR